MDSLVFPPSGPTPLILPRRLSLHGSPHAQRTRLQASSGEGGSSLPSSLEREELAHYYYFPTTSFPSHPHQGPSQPGLGFEPIGQSPLSPRLATANPPVILSFGNDHGRQDGFVTDGNSLTGATANTYSGPSIATIRGPTSRRHSVSGGSSFPWTKTVPPRHALHMPVMKIDPSIWRGEQHQREIYRLMREGRDEEVMKRRGVKNVMDTMTEEEEDESADRMSGVVQTIDLGGIKASEEREKEIIRQQVREEWARLVEEQTREYEMLLAQAREEARRRNSWPRQLDQQQVQFKSPSQVLHPMMMTTTMPSVPQQQMPNQAPAPVQQLGLQGQNYTNYTVHPLSNPTAWSAAPAYAVDTRRPSFTVYRG
ncbi:hypothetical protein EDD21DRAFT_411921 [Dissophora ornata]|nr:hypothetical protein BGZ58_002739 [Dissophora ornata]KAI8604630.1 hypothetical protein EDD21DRAFT_411921 [Dissophora ornata]